MFLSDSAPMLGSRTPNAGYRLSSNRGYAKPAPWAKGERRTEKLAEREGWRNEFIAEGGEGAFVSEGELLAEDLTYDAEFFSDEGPCDPGDLIADGIEDRMIAEWDAQWDARWEAERDVSRLARYQPDDDDLAHLDFAGSDGMVADFDTFCPEDLQWGFSISTRPGGAVTGRPSPFTNA